LLPFFGLDLWLLGGECDEGDDWDRGDCHGILQDGSYRGGLKRSLHDR
jgi:hypothetical protein